VNRPRAINLPPAVLWLALAFIGIHGLRSFLGDSADEWILLAFAFIPERYGDLAYLLPGGIGALIWSPVTYAFLHADLVHLFVNIVWMASFGAALARRFGSVRFLALALLSGVAGAGAHYLFHPSDSGVVIGASGAVSGMMAGTARFAFAPGGPLADAPGPPRSYRLPAQPLGAVFRDRRALAFIIIWFAVNLIFGLSSGLIPGVSGPIAWEAHVGGFVAGLLLFPLLDPIRPDSFSGDPLAS
jgi:membrane associated rhomboid family serine protease